MCFFQLHICELEVEGLNPTEVLFLRFVEDGYYVRVVGCNSCVS